MDFGYPPALLVLLLLPILGVLWLRGRRQQRQAIARLGAGLQRYFRPIASGRRRRTWLWFFGLGLLLLSLARPQWGEEITAVENGGLQIMIVLDVSRSMWAADAPPSRLAQAQQIVRALIPLLEEQDEIGLTLFAGESRIVLPLTLDHDTALLYLAQASTEPGLAPGTRLGPAIETATRCVTAVPGGQPVLLLLADGEDQGSQPLAAAQTAAAAGVHLYVIGLGSRDGAPVPVLDAASAVSGYEQDAQGEVILTRLEGAHLQRIASSGAGGYFPAATVQQDLSSLVDELAAVRARNARPQPEMRPREQYQMFVLAALLILSLLEVAPPGRKRQSKASPAGGRWRLSLMLLLLAPGACLSGCAPFSGARQVQQGNEAYEQGRYPAALAAYQAAQTAVPDTAEPAYNAANALYRQQEFVQAQQTMEPALSRANGDLAVAGYFNLGNFYFAAGDFEQAIVAYQTALRRRPDDADAKHNLELALRQLAGQSPEEEEAGAAGGVPEPMNVTETAAGSGDHREQSLPTTEPTSGQPAHDSEDGSQPQVGQGVPHPAVPMTPAEAQQFLDAINDNTGVLRQPPAPDVSPPSPPSGPDW